MRKEKSNAYMTVEAGLVLPIIIVIFIFLFAMLVFQYDRCLLEQDMAMMVLWGLTAQLDEAEDSQEQIEGKLQEIYWDKYVLWTMDELRAGVKHHRFFVSGAGETVLGKRWETKTEYDYELYDPVSFIRGTDQLIGQ